MSGRDKERGIQIGRHDIKRLLEAVRENKTADEAYDGIVVTSDPEKKGLLASLRSLGVDASSELSTDELERLYALSWTKHTLLRHSPVMAVTENPDREYFDDSDLFVDLIAGHAFGEIAGNQVGVIVKANPRQKEKFIERVSDRLKAPKASVAKLYLPSRNQILLDISQGTNALKEHFDIGVGKIAGFQSYVNVRQE